jgi:hypothetical protein
MGTSCPKGRKPRQRKGKEKLKKLKLNAGEPGRATHYPKINKQMEHVRFPIDDPSTGAKFSAASAL